MKPLVIALLASVLVACTGEDDVDSPAGSGGASAGTGGEAAGGSTGGAGSSATGGNAPTAGSSGTAGTGGSGGVSGTSGTAGAPGGSGGAGGRGGAGGATDTGGAAGTSPGGAGGGAAGAGGRAAGGAGGGAAGGAGGSGAGSGGTAGGYQPCKSNPCKILPLGDSITYGVGDENNGGYRGPLFAAAVAAGEEITFTGSLSNGPTPVAGQTFSKRNEGHSGWGIARVTPYSNGNAGIATVVPSPAFSSASGGTPEIVLLHIGTNDQGSFTASQMLTDLGGLIDKIIANAPDALVVVAQIIPLGYGTNDVIKTYNQAIPGLVQQRAAAGKHVVLVDMYTGFTPSSMLGADNIHPNTTGYKLMADRWHAAIGPLLPRTGQN